MIDLINKTPVKSYYTIQTSKHRDLSRIIVNKCSVAKLLSKMNVSFVTYLVFCYY